MTSPTSFNPNKEIFKNNSPSLNSLRELLNEVDFPKKTPSSEEKGVGKAKLEKAYSMIKGDDLESLFLQAAEILTKYARLSYEDFYPHCMVLMRASLNVQLVALGICNDLCFDLHNDSLEEIKKDCMDHNKFSTFDDFLLSSDVLALAEQIKDKNLGSDQLYTMAFTLSWMANSLHHTQGYKEKDENSIIQEQNHKRFDQIYFLTEQVLKLAGTKEADLELAELYYNGLRGVELRNDPKNLKAAHAWLEKAIKLNPTKEFAARVANLKSCDYSSIGDLINAKNYIDEAIEIRKYMKVEKQDPFMVANLWCRRSGFSLKEGNLEEAIADIGKSLEYAESCRSERNPDTDKLIDHKNDHQYFGYYDLQMAKFQFLQENTKNAKKHIERALNTFEFHEQDSADFIKMALELKEKIENAKD